MEVRGLWDWHPELPEPLLVLYDQLSGKLEHVVTGHYRAASQAVVAFTLPLVSASRLRVRLSQTGEVQPETFDANYLELRLLDAPRITGVHPRLFDIRQTSAFAVEVSGSNFYKDGDISHSIENLQCMINSQAVPIAFQNATFVTCMLTPDPLLQTYSLSLSLNFGLQWTQASDFPIRALVVPDIAEMEPVRLSSNLLTAVSVNLTASGLKNSEIGGVGLSFGHFIVVRRTQLGPLSFVYVLRPIGAMPDTPITVGIESRSFPSYVSSFSGLRVLGASVVLKTSPAVVLESL